MMRTLPIVLLTAALTAGCEPEPEHAPGPFTGSLAPSPGAYQAATLFRTIVVDPAQTLDAEAYADRAYPIMVDDALTLIDTAEFQLEVMVENLADQQIADAIVAAFERGIDVRVVADVDRREQRGFRILEEGGLAPVYGDGPILWNGVFGEDPILRTGEDNRLTHNVIIADRHRLLSMSAGFPEDGREVGQAGFAAISEVLARDFGNIFDQLHGGVFATTLTYYDQPVPSDSNNRTIYTTEEGAFELYFGPQEPLVKELVDRIYAARSAVWIATPIMLNSEVARALRYKARAQFDVRIVVGTTDGTRDEAEALPSVLADIAARRDNDTFPGFRLNPGLQVGGTLIIIDGKPFAPGDEVQPGVAMVLTAPLFESVPYYVAGVRPDGLDLEAQPSDRFTDAHLWAVHGVPEDSADFLRMRAQFERLYAASAPFAGAPDEEMQ